jgi:hypothetical protein
MRVSNNKARQYVEKLEEFQGSNTFGKWLHDSEESKDKIEMLEKIYVVYSYGHHFPMYVYDKAEQKWVGNKDKYSQSTTRHQSQLRPSSVGLWLNTDEVASVVRSRGIVGYLINKAQQ